MTDLPAHDAGHLVPATAADVPRIVDLLNAAYRGHGANAGWTDERAILSGPRTTVQLLSKTLAGATTSSLLVWRAADHDRVDGCVLLEPAEPGCWYLGTFAVDPRRQDSGTGRAILAAAESWARARGANRLKMTVITARQELIAWYNRRGYAPTGETLPFPYHDRSVGTPLRSDLRFAVLEKHV